MTLFYTVALMMLAIVIANFLAQAVPKIPKAFWQILAGILLALIPGVSGFTLELDPEWFMMLIIAPLLFYEGQRTSVRLISRNFGAIVTLAGTIAILTVVVLLIYGNRAIGWPLPLALALAAIVTPTDATALESVTEGREVPKGIKRALTLESLFNDATGLVVLQLALLWMNTGSFSFVHGFEEFILVAGGGAIVGGLAAFVIIYIRQHLLKAQLDDMVAHVMIYFLSPILVYALAEHFEVSGIIAVVVMGVISNEEQHHTQFMSSQLSNLNNQLTTIISQVLNGFVFVLLGLSLVRVFKVFAGERITDWAGFIGFGVIIYFVMVFFRHVMIERSKQDGIKAMVDAEHINRDAWIFGVGGVHGTVTMAMAFSLPLTLNDGTAFPHRDAILLIAATVILMSLIFPMVVFPKYLAKAEPEFGPEDYSKAHLEMINAAMAYVETTSATAAAKRAVIDQLQDQLGYGEDQLDRETWMRARAEITEVVTDAIEDAIQDEVLSEPTMIYYRRVMANQNRQFARGRRNVLIWFRILESIFQRLFLSRGRNEKRRMNRRLRLVEQRIQRLQRHQGSLSRHDQQELDRAIEYRARLADIQNQGGFAGLREQYENTRTVVFRELDEITAPAIADALSDAEERHEDPRYVIALRDVAAQESDRWRDQQNANTESQNLLLAALQTELSYVQAGRDRVEFSPGLLKQLYDEVTAAQALVLAAEDTEE
jgi:CPA1 family monovalent cation:H+ antiporter